MNTLIGGGVGLTAATTVAEIGRILMVVLSIARSTSGKRLISESEDVCITNEVVPETSVPVAKCASHGRFPAFRAPVIYLKSILTTLRESLPIWKSRW
jgi:hypothetical protein